MAATWPASVQVNREVPPETLDQLGAAVTERLERLSPWRPFVTRVVFLADLAGKQASAALFTTLGGPSDQIEAYCLPSDQSAPNIPADVTWAAGDNVTPREIAAITTPSHEFLADARLLGPITAGTPQADPGVDHLNPLLIAHLGDALIRKDNALFAAGAGTTAEPVRGLANHPSITTTALNTQLGFVALLEAYWNLVEDGRFPNAAFVSPTEAKRLRTERDTDGSLVFPPGKPMLLDVRRNADGSETAVPIVPIDGMPTDASRCALVGDFRHVTVIHRVMPNGKLVGVAASDLRPGAFDTYSRTWRVAERFDLGIAPGSAPNIVKMTFAG